MTQKNRFIIKQRLNEWLLNTALYIVYFLLLIIPPFLYIWTPTRTAKYLRKIYNRNWSSNYITDIKVTNDKCDSGYETKILGYWSGIAKNSCLCKSSSIQFATDDNEICKKSKYKEIFQCSSLPIDSPFSISQYYGGKLCIKRDLNSMTRLHSTLKDNYNTKDKNEFLSYLNSHQINVDKNAITDILITKSNTPPDNYETIGSLDVLNVYIKRYGETTATIYQYNDFITDIHLYNELLCAYSSMSDISPYQDNRYDMNYIEYHNEHCNSFSNNGLNVSYTNLYYNDNSTRVKKITNDLSTEDFYSYNESNYYKTNGITIVNSDSSDLVYERYLYGIGCVKTSTPQSHYNKYKYVKILKKLSLSIVVVSIFVYSISIMFMIFKLFDNCIMYPCTYYILSFFLFFCNIAVITLSSIYYSFASSTVNYLKDFRMYCQTDYSQRSENSFKGLSIETQMISDIEFAASLDIAIIVISCVCLALMIVFYALNCDQHKMFVLLPSEHYKNQNTRESVNVNNVNIELKYK